MVNMIASYAGGRELYPDPAKSYIMLPKLQFLRRLLVLPWCYVAEMDPANLLHASTGVISKYHKKFCIYFMKNY